MVIWQAVVEVLDQSVGPISVEWDQHHWVMLENKENMFIADLNCHT